MPKEFINNRYYGQRSTDSNGDAVAIDDSAVKVGWSKEAEHVEIAVVHHRDGSADDEHEAWHSQMDRAGLNRLIRALRQARDDAYGRDE